MASRNQSGIAQSRYRQIRLQITQEVGGRCSYSLYAKPMNKEWREQDCLVRDSLHYDYPIVTAEDAIRATIECLKEQLLPGCE